MYWIIAAAVVIALIAWVLLRKAKFFGKLCSGEHYLEFARSVAQAKEAACRQTVDLPERPDLDDPRAFLTSGMLAFVYSAVHEGSQYIHHFSISLPGRYTPGAIGLPYILYTAKLLDLDPSTFTVGVSPAYVYHAEFVLDEIEHNALAQRPVQIPASEEAAKALGRQCSEQIHTIKAEPIQGL